MILINYGSFFQKKDYLQLNRFQFLEINSLMAETIKNQFSKTISCKQIAEFGKKLFILENWKLLSCRDAFF